MTNDALMTNEQKKNGRDYRPITQKYKKKFSMSVCVNPISVRRMEEPEKCNEPYVSKSIRFDLSIYVCGCLSYLSVFASKYQSPKKGPDRKGEKK